MHGTRAIQLAPSHLVFIVHEVKISISAIENNRASHEGVNVNMAKADEKRHKLFDLFLDGGHSFSLRALELVSGAAKVTQHIMTLVMQEDVLHL